MAHKKHKYIFVTGGVVSSIGKGIVTSSLGTLLKARGLRVTIQKLDPYINVDAGTMNPYQHGEVYVTDDGAETDLDLGHYERYIDENLAASNNVTTGKVYNTVISRERRGDYLGDTVRVIPHITDQIKAEIRKVAEESDADVALVEIGGTVGDIESLPFIEAIRQFKKDAGEGNVLYIHLTLVPHLGAAGELKTKPTQHSVKELRAIGIHPEIIVCRTQKGLNREMRAKIALYCDVEEEAIIESKDVDCIYEIPLLMEKQGLGSLVTQKLRLPATTPELEAWKQLVKRIKKPAGKVRITLVGKYVELKDAYLSIEESLQHSGAFNNVAVDIHRIDAEDLVNGTVALDELFASTDGILVPGGFGSRGIEGKVKAIEYARTRKIPYLGICYGLQWAVVEFARNVLGWNQAHSTEVDAHSPHPVVHLLPNQEGVDMGGTMRLGAYPCKLEPNTLAHAAYEADEISERHRHRYEVNNALVPALEKAGMRFSGRWPERNLVEIVELTDHPWFLACQFHPEFKTRPGRPHPLFRDFVKASVERHTARTQQTADTEVAVARASG
ncbi:MAG: CTP synthase [Proteobacteria bacterium]|nr:CTP synthase [Pseudomonadota bacterium]